ncbi:MAG TPA: alpha/beta fold hydrolase [Jatrophihabitans sp.]|jgi:triacylglycerol esterase/lipase EstA (alpha/beta hydrolase family)|uniref:esterase/lipase family protein n=1 Tax=Jatrophihabitans sp. TaxID=1932789 RepID=UPI002E03109F|nr:alpha/beta fold hydrolase [Jatrophihabitans sp.]
MLSSLAPARRRLVLIAIGVVVAAVVAAVLAVVASRSDPAAPVSQQMPGPVLLVPGYGGSTTAVSELAGVLRRHGKDATVVTLPGDGRGDLDAQARALGRAVDAVLRRTRAASVDVIGYSAGGVVARLWVRDHGGARQARRVITLGAPHHGTDIAALAGSTLPGACPTACRQLSPTSGLLAALNAGDETPPGPTWVSVWTTHDDTVLPPASAALEGALDLTVQSVCPHDTVNHGGLPTDPDVQSVVLAELAAGPPVTPTRCGVPRP